MRDTGGGREVAAKPHLESYWAHLQDVKNPSNGHTMVKRMVQINVS